MSETKRFVSSFKFLVSSYFQTQFNKHYVETAIENRYAWYCSLFFIGFESIYWILGQKFANALVNYFKYGQSIMEPFTSIPMMLWHLFALAVSFWCFKQFVKCIFLYVKKELGR